MGQILTGAVQWWRWIRKRMILKKNDDEKCKKENEGLKTEERREKND